MIICVMTSDSKGQDMQVQFFPISLQHTRDISGVHFFFLESHSNLDLESYPFNLNSLYKY